MGININNMYYKISKVRLLNLRKAAAKLKNLEAYGVETWESYGEAMRDAYNDGEYDIRKITDEELLDGFEEID